MPIVPFGKIHIAHTTFGQEADNAVFAHLFAGCQAWKVAIRKAPGQGLLHLLKVFDCLLLMLQHIQEHYFQCMIIATGCGNKSHPLLFRHIEALLINMLQLFE